MEGDTRTFECEGSAVLTAKKMSALSNLNSF